MWRSLLTFERDPHLLTQGRGLEYVSCCLSLCAYHFLLSIECRYLSGIYRQNTTDTQRDSQEEEIVSVVRTSLVDDEAVVRSAAAKAFDVLQEQLGPKAIDQTIPTLLEALRQPGESSETALQALKEVMIVSLQ